MSRQQRTRAWLALGLILSALGAVGNGAAFAASSRDSEAEIERLRSRVVELEREATVGRVETTRLRAELTRLETEIDELHQQLERAKPCGSETVTEPEPTGPLIETGPTIEETAIEEEPLVGTTVAEPLAPTGTPPAPVAEPSTGESGPPQTLYDEAYTLFHQKLYDEAERRFERFLSLYPTSDLADNALFWIGECRYAQGELQAALEAFTRTVERYPEGNKIPDAMLKAGKCFEALGDLDAARETYEEIRRRFPATGAATLASERLQALARSPSP